MVRASGNPRPIRVRPQQRPVNWFTATTQLQLQEWRTIHMDEYIRIRRGFLAEITLCHRVITLRKTAAPCKEDRRTRGCGRMVCGRWAGRVTPCHTRSPSPSPSATLSWTMLSVLYPPPQAEIPGSDALEKKFNCRPAASRPVTIGNDERVLPPCHGVSAAEAELC
jgi:hypothetical protein